MSLFFTNGTGFVCLLLTNGADFESLLLICNYF